MTVRVIKQQYQAVFGQAPLCWQDRIASNFAARGRMNTQHQSDGWRRVREKIQLGEEALRKLRGHARVLP